MATEHPKYLISQGSYIEGMGVLAREGPEEHSLPYPHVTPRNSWQPLNDAAKAAFADRNAKVMAKHQAEIDELQKTYKAAIEDGAREEEAAGIIEQISRLRVEKSKLPARLKAVPRAGPPAQYTHSEPTPISEAQRGPHFDETIERLVNAARGGGASENDIKTLRATLAAEASKPSEDAPAPATASKPADPKAEAPKVVETSKPKFADKPPEKPAPKRASDT